ncbi:MAG: tetratricopeptide repeat protein, partial [Hyphomicrobium sp.]
TLAHLSRQAEKCLLIYDDAASAAELHPLLPNGNVHVLITSNSPNWRSEASPIELNSWSIDCGAQYFMRRLVNVDPGDAKALSEQLDGLPLLLELAATFCERRGMTLKGYQQRLIEAPLRDILSREIRTPGYSRFIDAALELSIGAATVEHQAAAVVIETLSSFPYSTVPLSALRRGWAAMQNILGTNFDDDALDAAVAALRNHSLISVTTRRRHWRLPHYDVISIHRLVGMIAQRSVTDLNRQQRAMASILAANLPTRLSSARHDEHEDDTNWSRYQIQLLRANSTASFYQSEEFSLLQMRSVIATLWRFPKGPRFWRARRNIVLTSKHPEAVAERVSLPLTLAFNSIRQQRNRAGRDNLTMASMLLVFGVCLVEHEKYRSAEIALNQSLRIRERLLAPYHPDIAEAISALAYCAECRGSHADALLLRKKLIQSRRKLWPKENLDVADAFVNLAECYIRTGNIEAATPALAHAVLIEAALTDRIEAAMRVSNPALVAAFLYLPDWQQHLDTLLNTVRFLADVRGDSDGTVAKARMEIGFAIREVGLFNVGREIVLKGLVCIPNPHVVRMDAYLRLGRKYPSYKAYTEGPDFVVGMLRRALAQAEFLKNPDDIRVGTILLAMTLENVPGCEDEALALNRRYPPAPAD